MLLAHDDTAETTDLPGRVIFLACSGAVGDDFFLQPQFSGDPVGGPSQLQANGVYAPGQTQLEQLAGRRAKSHPAIAFALVSVGGNDANFATIVKTCIAPGDCSVFAPRWNALVDSLPATLDRAYRRIGEVIPKGRVIVVPYPIPISDRADCPSATYTLSERRFLVEFTNRLDDVITAEAKRHGFLVADTRNTMSDAHARVCDTGEKGINGVSLNPQEGQLAQLANPSNWLHDSMHPNAYGHRLLEAALAKWFDAPSTKSALGEHDAVPRSGSAAGRGRRAAVHVVPRLLLAGLPRHELRSALDTSATRVRGVEHVGLARSRMARRIVALGVRRHRPLAQVRDLNAG